MSGKTIGSSGLFDGYEMIVADNEREWFVLNEYGAKARKGIMLQSEFWLDDDDGPRYSPPTMTEEQARRLTHLKLACCVSAIDRWNRGVTGSPEVDVGSEYFFLHFDPKHTDQVLAATRGILEGDVTAGDDFVEEMRNVIEAGTKWHEGWQRDFDEIEQPRQETT